MQPGSRLLRTAGIALLCYQAEPFKHYQPGCPSSTEQVTNVQRLCPCWSSPRFESDLRPFVKRQPLSLSSHFLSSLKPSSWYGHEKGQKIMYLCFIYFTPAKNLTGFFFCFSLMTFHANRQSENSSTPWAHWSLLILSLRWLWSIHVMKRFISPLCSSVKIVSKCRQRVSHLKLLTWIKCIN